MLVNFTVQQVVCHQETNPKLRIIETSVPRINSLTLCSVFHSPIQSSTLSSLYS